MARLSITFQSSSNVSLKAGGLGRLLNSVVREILLSHACCCASAIFGFSAPMRTNFPVFENNQKADWYRRREREETGKLYT
jgi:hypothetical protein